MKKSINRTNTLTRSLCLSAIAFTSATILAEDLTVSSDQTLALSTETTYDNLVLENGAKLTLTKSGSNAQTLKVTGAISGTGAIELNSAKVAIAADVPSTVKWIITGNYSTSTTENRILRNVAEDITINGPFEGDSNSIVRIGTLITTTKYIKLNGDNSGFKGLIYVDGNTNDRLRFGCSEAVAENARWYFPGTQAGQVQTEFESAGIIKLGSVYTDKANNSANHLRFNNGSTMANTLEIGALNGHFNGEDVVDRITLTLGDANNASEKIVKVGNGVLQLGDTRHYNGTIISNGIVEAVHSAALTKGVVTFDGGSLKYGDRLYTGDDAAWGSQDIKNSTKDVIIDTGTNDVSYAAAIDASNVGGFVKKGMGTLEVQGYSAYVGKTIISNGTLKVGFQYNNTDGLGGRVFEKSEGANLEVTLYNPSLTHANEATILTGIPNGSTVNFTVSNDDGRGLPRLTEVTSFSGVLNFTTSKTTSGSAGGLVGSVATLGSDSIEWNITGEPVDAHTRLFDVEGSNSGAVAKFGALRQTSPNGMIYSKYGNTTLKIGALGKDSVINGQIETYSPDNAVTVQSIGGKLTLGENFAVVANGGTEYTGTATFNITGGAIENNADLSAFTVNLSSGVTLSGSGNWPAGMTMPASYGVPGTIDGPACATGIDVDFSNGASLVLDMNGFESNEESRQSEHQVLVAKSINGLPDSSLLTSLNAGDTKGKWKFRKATNGDGTMTLALAYAKNAFMIIVR